MGDSEMRVAGGRLVVGASKIIEGRLPHEPYLQHRATPAPHNALQFNTCTIGIILECTTRYIDIIMHT